jgi:hypothetical protein
MMVKGLINGEDGVLYISAIDSQIGQRAGGFFPVHRHFNRLAQAVLVVRVSTDRGALPQSGMKVQDLISGVGVIS